MSPADRQKRASSESLESSREHVPANRVKRTQSVGTVTSTQGRERRGSLRVTPQRRAIQVGLDLAGLIF